MPPKPYNENFYINGQLHLYGWANDGNRPELKNLGWEEVEVNDGENYVLWRIPTREVAGKKKTNKATGGQVWMVTEERGMFVGNYDGSTNQLGQFESSHMKMYMEIINKYGKQIPLFAGSIKDDGQWGRNSAFNNTEVATNAATYKGLNGPVVASIPGQLATPWDRARDTAVKVGDVPCSSKQLAHAQQLYSQGKYLNI